MKKTLSLLGAVLGAALALGTAQAQTNIGSLTLTNRVSLTDRFVLSDTNRGAGGRTLTIAGTNLLPALLAVPTAAVPDLTLSRNSNAIAGLNLSVTSHTNPAIYGSFSVSTNIIWRAGIGSPESSVTAGVGSLYSRIDGSTIGTHLYIKTNGTGNTGWWGAQ